MWYDAMALAYKLFVHSFSLLKSFILFWNMAMLNAQTKVAIGYIREQSCDTRDDMIPICCGMYAMYGVDHYCAQVTLPTILKWLVSIGK